MNLKRVLILFIVILLNISFLPVIADDVQPIPFFPSTYYYSGNLMWLGNVEDKPVINEVVLTVSGMDYHVPVKEDGSFIQELSSVNETAVISIPDENYYIPEDIPTDNNVIFSSNVDSNSKNIYFGKVNIINGIVATYNDAVNISDATVTCYRRVDNTSNWELWKSSTLSPSPVRKTDAEGKFSFKVINGEYRFEVLKEGYDDYNSFNYEYVKDNTSLISTLAGGNLSPVLHMSNIRVLKLLESNPSNGQTVPLRDEFYLRFDKSIIQKSVDDNDSIQLQLDGSGTNVPYNILINDKEVKITPKASLIDGQKYKLIVTTKIIATDGSTLTNEQSISFTASEQGVKQQIGDNQSSQEETNTNNSSIMKDLNGHWAKDYVERLVRQGIVSGNEQPDGSLMFYPDNQISRQEFAKLIILSNKMSLTDSADLPFADGASIDNWAKPYVVTAYQNGLIKGTQNENGQLIFDPNAAITRAEIMTIIGRLFGSSDVSINFADWNDVPDWAKQYVAVCVEKKLVAGYEENNQMLIKPLKNITRAEAATIIAKLIEVKASGTN